MLNIITTDPGLFSGHFPLPETTTDPFGSLHPASLPTSTSSTSTLPCSTPCSSLSPTFKVTFDARVDTSPVSAYPHPSESGIFWCVGFFFLKILFIFERGREGEREGEKHQCVVTPPMTPTRDLAATQACTPIRNRTGNPLVHRPVLNPLSHTSQDRKWHIL